MLWIRTCSTYTRRILLLSAECLVHKRSFVVLERRRLFKASEREIVDECNGQAMADSFITSVCWWCLFSVGVCLKGSLVSHRSCAKLTHKRCIHTQTPRSLFWPSRAGYLVEKEMATLRMFKGAQRHATRVSFGVITVTNHSSLLQYQGGNK